jgi:hypothetical protein
LVALFNGGSEGRVRDLNCRIIEARSWIWVELIRGCPALKPGKRTSSRSCIGYIKEEGEIEGELPERRGRKNHLREEEERVN